MSEVVLFIMNQKGYEVLAGVVENFGKDVIRHVITSVDDNVEKDYHHEITALCKDNQISCYERADYPDYDKYAIAIGWKWLIKETGKLIIIHDSLLPKYRGFSPLVSALINGDTKIGVTAIFAEKEYDTGKIIAQRQTAINYPIKIKEAIEAVILLYKELAGAIIGSIIDGNTINSTPQDEQQVTYSLWRDEEDYHLNWALDAATIKRFIDAVGYPYKGAFVMSEMKKYRVIDSEVVDDVSIVNRSPGKIIFTERGCPVVVCGKGLLKITKMLDDENGNTALPIKKFRTRYQ